MKFTVQHVCFFTQILTAVWNSDTDFEHSKHEESLQNSFIVAVFQSNSYLQKLDFTFK